MHVNPTRKEEEARQAQRHYVTRRQPRGGTVEAFARRARVVYILTLSTTDLY